MTAPDGVMTVSGAAGSTPGGARLAQAFNLRDLGGAAAGNGHRVRRGLVYRSAMLSRADVDFDRLRALGVRTIIDLRASDERGEDPTPWQALGCTDYWCLDHPRSDGNLSRIVEGLPGEAEARIREEMVQIYRILPYAQRQAARALFEAVAEQRTPILFHCAAGKDRTGVLAALLLSALNVPMEAIVADYVLTNAFDIQATRRLRGGAAINAPAAVLARLFAADPIYLEATFAEIDSRFGSLQSYLDDILCLEESDLARVRAHLLEPA